MTPPRRHWRSYGNDPLPTPQEAKAATRKDPAGDYRSD
jgi:hypothetical protein